VRMKLPRKTASAHPAPPPPPPVCEPPPPPPPPPPPAPVFGSITDPNDPRLYGPRSGGSNPVNAQDAQTWFVNLRSVDLSNTVVVAKLVPGDYLFAARRLEWQPGAPLYLIVENPPPMVPPEGETPPPEPAPTPIITDPQDPRLRAPRSDGLATLTAEDMRTWFLNLHAPGLERSPMLAKNDVAYAAVKSVDWVQGGPLYVVVEADA
jgi:hypothetical protein